MKYVPHEYQRYAIDWIINHRVCAVLLDMGLGKTSITLTALQSLLFERFESGVSWSSPRCGSPGIPGKPKRRSGTICRTCV